jgi:striatin 1/3/4
VQKKEITPKYQLRSHMDIVRGLLFVQDLDVMTSISEDCTLKLWSLNNLDNLYQETDGNPEPYITLRGHTGPLFSIAGPHNNHKRVIFTAGSEGVIRVWNLPHISDVS